MRGGLSDERERRAARHAILYGRVLTDEFLWRFLQRVFRLKGVDRLQEPPISRGPCLDPESDPLSKKKVKRVTELPGIKSWFGSRV